MATRDEYKVLYQWIREDPIRTRRAVIFSGLLFGSFFLIASMVVWSVVVAS